MTEIDITNKNIKFLRLLICKRYYIKNKIYYDLRILKLQ